MLGPAIYSKLSGDAAVAAIVGTRIFPEDVPQTLRTFPLIVYTMGDAEHLSNFTGSSHLANRRVTIESAAMTYEAAQGLADAVRAAFADQSGTWGGITVQGAFIESQSDAQQSIVAGEDYNVFVIEQEFLIWFAT
jgi:hypothetical protein